MVSEARRGGRGCWLVIEEKRILIWWLDIVHMKILLNFFFFFETLAMLRLW